MINNVQIIINAGKGKLDELILCLQGIIANTPLDQVQLIIYLSNNHLKKQEIANNLVGDIELEIRYLETDLWSNIVADAVEKLPDGWEMVLLSREAVPSSGWLDSLSHVAQRDDVGLVTSREIRQGTDRLAWKLVPYTSNLNDIDVALSPENNLVLDPGFDESQMLVKISRFTYFCVFFCQKILKLLDWQKLKEMEDQDWIALVSNIVIDLNKKAIVYTPYAKVYYSNHLQ